MFARRLVPFVVAVTGAVLAGGLLAQDEKTPKPHVRMDDASRKLLREWKAQEYHLGRAGIQKISYKVHATVQTGADIMARQAVGSYLWSRTWQNGTGQLKWNNAALGRRLAQDGWGREQLDMTQLPDYLERWLDGCELRAAPMPTHTRVTITGHRSGLKGFKFDKDGVLVGMIMEVGAPRGGRITIDCELGYHRDGRQFHVEGYTYLAKMPNGDTYRTVSKLSYRKVKGFHVLDKVEESSTLAGRNVGRTTLVFSDYKINDQVMVPSDARGQRKRTPKGTPRGTPKGTSKK